MDEFGIGARIAAFDRRNGGNPVQWGGWFFYLNGAQRDTDPLGPLIDPPSDEYDLLTNILSYHKARLRRAVQEFDAFKEQALHSDNSCEKETLAALNELKDTVSAMNEACVEAQKNLDNTPQRQRRAAILQSAAEQTQRQKEFRDSVRAIRI